MGKVVKTAAKIAGTIALIAGAILFPVLAPLFLSAAMTIGSSALKDIAGSHNTADSGTQISMAQGAAEPREYVYGQRRTGGSIMVIDTAGSDNDDLWINAIVASHEIDSFVSYHMDEKTVTISGSAVQTSPYNGFADIYTQLGADAQVAISAMTTALSNWGTNHRNRGNATVAWKLNWDQDVYPGGIPNMSVTIKGKKVYDPRVGGHLEDDPSTWEYSANPVLCCLDYMRDSLLGPNIPWAAFSAANIIDAANECDETVETVANRYECHAVINSEMVHAEVIALFEKSMAGSIAYSGGVFSFHPGRWDAVSVSFDEDDILSVSVTPTPSRKDLVNAVKGLFIDPAQSYQPVDFPPKTDSGAESEDGGERFWLDLDLPFTTDHKTAQRIAKIAFERSRRRMTVSMRVNLKGLGVKVMDTIDVTHANFGWSSKTFRVVEWRMGVAGDDSFSCDLVLREEDSTVYSWEESSDLQTFGTVPTTGFFLPFGINLSLPGGVGFISLPFTGSNGITVPGLQLAYNTPAAWIESIQAQYKLNAEAATLYRPIPNQALIGPDQIHFPVVPEDWDVRVRNLSIFGTYSDWETVSATTVPEQSSDATAGANWGTNLTGQPQNLLNFVRYPFFDAADEADIFALGVPHAQHAVINDPLGKYPKVVEMTGTGATNKSKLNTGFIPIEPSEEFYYQFSAHKDGSVNAGADVGIEFRWYDKDKVLLSISTVLVDQSALSTSAWTVTKNLRTASASAYFLEMSVLSWTTHTAGKFYLVNPIVYRAADTNQIVDDAVTEPFLDSQTSSQTMATTQNLWQTISGISLTETFPSGVPVDVWVLLSGSARTQDSTGYSINVRVLEDGSSEVLKFTYAWGSNDMTTQSEGSFDFNVPLLGRLTGDGSSHTYTVQVQLVTPFVSGAGGWQTPVGFWTRDSQLVMRRVSK